MSIRENLERILKSIPKNVVVVAATKTKNLEEIKEVIDAGTRVIGENYLQEAERKHVALKGKIDMHCIGHLQSNKVKKAVQIFDMIQTVDSLKIAKEIDKRCFEIEKVMPVLIEINIAEEENKKGCYPEKTMELARNMDKLKNIKLKGIMTMGPSFSAEKLRPYFKKTKILFDKLKKDFPDIDTLSMGMSDSFNVAIDEGATMVRLGNVIFGERS